MKTESGKGGRCSLVIWYEIAHRLIKSSVTCENEAKREPIHWERDFRQYVSYIFLGYFTVLFI